MAVSMTAIEEGSYSGIEDARQVAIRTEAEWHAFWRRHTSNTQPPRAPPAVDFSAEMAVCVFMGTQSTGGYSIRIKSIEQGASGLSVSCETTSPRGGLTTQALTQPYHMVRIASSDAPLEFVVNEAAPPPVKEFTFNVCVDKALDKEKMAAVGDEMAKLTGVTRTHSMFGGKIVTVKFDAAAVGGQAAAELLKAIPGVTTVEADGLMSSM